MMRLRDMAILKAQENMLSNLNIYLSYLWSSRPWMKLTKTLKWRLIILYFLIIISRYTVYWVITKPHKILKIRYFYYQHNFSFNANTCYWQHRANWWCTEKPVGRWWANQDDKKMLYFLCFWLFDMLIMGWLYKKRCVHRLSIHFHYTLMEAD